MLNFFISIGGTGARVAEAVVHLCAAGVIPKGEQIQFLFVDQDQGNGNLDRVKSLLANYQACRQAIDLRFQEIFSSELSIVKKGAGWAPAEDAKLNLREVLGYHSLPKGSSENYTDLLDSLMTAEEQTFTLDQGFVGRPKVGSAVFLSTVDFHNADPWHSLLETIETETNNGNDVNVFLAGTIFGGTGASGIPTISARIRETTSKSASKKKVRIGAILLLPYFGYSIPIDKKDSLSAKTQNFMLKSAAALDYYHSENYFDIFDFVYLLGNTKLRKSDKFAMGAAPQRNDSHFVEVLAATAYADFLGRPNGSEPLLLIARDDDSRISWSDLPEGQKTKKLIGSFTRFSFEYVSAIYPTVVGKHNYKDSQIPWLTDFFRGDHNPSVDKAKSLQEYAVSFLTWLAQISYFKGGEEDVQFINWRAFAESGEGINDDEKIIKLKDASKFDERDFSELIMEAKGGASCRQVWNDISRPAGQKDFSEFVYRLYDACRI